MAVAQVIKITVYENINDASNTLDLLLGELNELANKVYSRNKVSSEGSAKQVVDTGLNAVAQELREKIHDALHDVREVRNALFPAENVTANYQTHVAVYDPNALRGGISLKPYNT